jgi:hypothetical protein
MCLRSLEKASICAETGWCKTNSELFTDVIYGVQMKYMK